MKTQRRQILKGAAALTAASALNPTRTAFAAIANTDFNEQVKRVQNILLRHLSAQGYIEIESSPLVTENHDFNGGLQFDTSTIPAAHGQIVVQPSARIGDISQKNRHDVLPIFHILRFDRLVNQSVSDGLKDGLNTLTGPLELDVERLVFVSVPAFEAFRSVLEESGIDWARQVYLRDDQEARHAKDGSGYFQYPGNDNAPLLLTAAAHYCLDDKRPDGKLSYPVPSNMTEIGELLLDPENLISAGFGIERLAYAQSGSIPSWEDRLVDLLSEIEAASAGRTTPPAKVLFEKG
ncbi:MAG: hypothetical protein ABJN26_08050 [Stappiaceae bacterium]